MSDDIVTRLRNWHTDHDSAFPRPIDLEAANEIERLRADRDRWRKIAKGEHYAWSQCSYDCDCLTEIYKKAMRDGIQS